MTCEKTNNSNVIVLKDDILVQLTEKYHVPFKLSGEEAQTLWEELDVALGKYKAKKAKNPFCLNCSHRIDHHGDEVGKCDWAFCGCKKYDLDVEYYKPSQTIDFDLGGEF